MLRACYHAGGMVDVSDFSSDFLSFDDGKSQSNDDKSFEAATEPSKGDGRLSFSSELPRPNLDFEDTAAFDTMLHKG